MGRELAHHITTRIVSPIQCSCHRKHMSDRVGVDKALPTLALIMTKFTNFSRVPVPALDGSASDIQPREAQSGARMWVRLGIFSNILFI